MKVILISLEIFEYFINNYFVVNLIDFIFTDKTFYLICMYILLKI